MKKSTEWTGAQVRVEGGVAKDSPAQHPQVNQGACGGFSVPGADPGVFCFSYQDCVPFQKVKR